MTLNKYYDCLIQLDDARVPSKRVGYKEDNGILVAKVPIGAREFEKQIREHFKKNKGPNWPYSGRLLMVIGISMSEKDFVSTDVDNVTKTLLDAFKGILYEDDSEIVSLFVNKVVGDSGHLIALKVLGKEDKAWVVPHMLEAVSGQNT